MLTKSELFCLLVLVIVFFQPVLAEGSFDTSHGYGTPDSVYLYRPQSGDMIHSAQITDLITAPDGTDVIATDYGLSTYNGEWQTRHINRENISAGLMADNINAIEYDSSGNLWIGFGSGIQIYNGKYYQVIRDQDLLKSLLIRDILRWDDDMWIATGNAGLHRYRDGCWTWYKPFSKGGPGFYEADSMALDSASNSLFVATDREGLWQVIPSNDSVVFGEIQKKSDSFGLLEHVRRDPSGGVYFFNKTAVVHYDPIEGFTLMTKAGDLSFASLDINDVATGTNGLVYLATDKGIFVVENGLVSRHMGMADGLGTSQVIRAIFTDAANRIWFSSMDDVGYYTGDMSIKPNIPIQMATDPTPEVPSPQNESVQDKNVSPDMVVNPDTASPKSPFDQFLESLAGIFSFLPLPR
jgi:ligand-binding sensor domain-containing protein